MWSRVMFSILERLWTWCRPGEREREQKRLKKQEILFSVSLFNKIKILLKNTASQSPPPPKKKSGFYGASPRAALILESSFWMCHPQEPPFNPSNIQKSTQLLFWCAARRVANGGLKNGYAPKIGAKAKRTEFLGKKCGLKNWILAKFEALERKFWLKLGSRTKMFKICDFCWKGDHKKTQTCWNGGPRTVPLFKVIPPEQKAYYPNMQISWQVNYNVNVLGHNTHSDQNSVK